MRSAVSTSCGDESPGSSSSCCRTDAELSSSSCFILSFVWQHLVSSASSSAKLGTWEIHCRTEFRKHRFFPWLLNPGGKGPLEFWDLRKAFQNFVPKFSRLPNTLDVWRLSSGETEVTIELDCVWRALLRRDDWAPSLLVRCGFCAPERLRWS